MREFAFAGALALASQHVWARCVIEVDPVPQIGWLSEMEVYRDGKLVGGAPPSVSTPCADLGVEPCTDCLYTARYRHGERIGPESAPFSIEIPVPRATLRITPRELNDEHGQ